MRINPHLLAIGAVLSAAPVSADTFPLVVKGRPRAVIVTARDISAPLRAAVEEMQRLIERASGARLEIAEASIPGLGTIHIGKDPAEYETPMDGLDADGFRVEFPDAATCVIRGPTDWGTEFGLYDFLERYVGVRWLMPGPDGTYVPTLNTIEIERLPVRDEPAFFSRKFFGLKHPAQQTWARRNRLHSRVEFHHQLAWLFPPKLYRETHPHFFPIHDGKRHLPADNSRSHWQPCFTADGIVEEAAKRIIQFFDTHPDASSYSFGVNDSGGHCECATCQALDSGRKNTLGRDHLSDRYFTWANAVAERVLERHPDKVFGCLAYSEIFEPPDRVTVHPRIIPYMTYDRMKWVDATYREQGHAMTQRWHRASPTMGWYDYIYGSIYCVPRVYFHRMAEYYRYGHQHGVRALTAEAYPGFGEGPKLYVSLKLQWDPFRNVDDMLSEWYRLCVGEAAAPFLRQYYQHWETFWTKRMLDTAWWDLHPRGQYLPFHSPVYLEAVTEEEMAVCRKWLETAVRKTVTQKQRARAELLLSAFEYYEASVQAYPRGAAASVPATESDALELAAELGGANSPAAKRRQLANEDFEGHPFLHFGTSIDRYSQISGRAWGSDRVWALFDWAERSRPVADAISALADNDRPEIRGPARAILRRLSGEPEALLRNPSFESGNAMPQHWHVWRKENVGTLTLQKKQAFSGEQAVMVQGMKHGGPHQTIPYQPGTYTLTCRVLLPELIQGHILLSVHAIDAQGRTVPPADTVRFDPVPGRWVILGMTADLNKRADAGTVRSGVWAKQCAPSDVAYFDDVVLTIMPPESRD